MVDILGCIERERPENLWITLPVAASRQLSPGPAAGLSVESRAKNRRSSRPSNMTLTENGQGFQILGGILILVGLGPLGAAASPLLLPFPSLWRHSSHCDLSA